jgi:hypothetical protein
MLRRMTHKPEAAILTNSIRLRGDTKELPSRICYFLPNKDANLQMVDTFPEAPSPYIKAKPRSFIIPAMLQNILALHDSVTASSKSTISNP